MKKKNIKNKTSKIKTSRVKKEVKTTPGTLRIKTADLQAYEKTENSWKKSSTPFPHVMLIINLFKANNNFDALIDKKCPEFLKGQLSPDGKTQGTRIKILPNGKELDKAFSLFATNLTIHDERSNHHWNVIYKNPGGTYSYLYKLEKKKMFVTKKYKVVKEFEEYYPKLERNAYNALKDENDQLAVPMYTLLKTCMRVGNEIYYNINRNQGLRTLKKKDISISGNCVLFDYIAKDGVPTNIKSEFPDIYIARLKKMLEETKDSSFIFVNKSTCSPIKDIDFKDAFKRYCGKEFYPHIVRSYYATLQVRKFLEKHQSPKKEEVRDLFLSIAQKLGHKRFAKNDGVWKESYTVTVNHYVQPALIRKIRKLVGKLGK